MSGSQVACSSRNPELKEICLFKDWFGKRHIVILPLSPTACRKEKMAIRRYIVNPIPVIHKVGITFNVQNS